MKYLFITNLSFILPKDFNGNLTEALEELVKYRKSEEAKKNRRLVLKNEQISDLLESKNSIKENERLALNFAIGEIDENGEYNTLDLEKRCD